jgi:hypothetical protein
VSPFIEEVSETQIDLTMKVTAEMPENNYGANVMVKIPCPKSTLGCSFNAEVATNYEYYTTCTTLLDLHL